MLWSLPKDIVFRNELPLTRVAKVAYTELELELERRRGRIAPAVTSVTFRYPVLSDR
ncbi:MAG: hypothetical protein RQ801_13025 [Spirochaetaceae bacterium]|nr:hypothetical protein [Spirochaetaceae bacterium]